MSDSGWGFGFLGGAGSAADRRGWLVSDDRDSGWN